MESRLTPATRRSRRAGWILILALLLLIALTVTVWAAWGAALRDGLGAARAASLTATPTRTPRPVTPAPTVPLVQPAIVAFTSTPSPAAPTATPVPQVTPAALPPYLERIVARYGMDPSRRFVVVDKDLQRMTIWDPAAPAGFNGKPLREFAVSTGDESAGIAPRPGTA